MLLEVLNKKLKVDLKTYQPYLEVVVKLPIELGQDRSHLSEDDRLAAVEEDHRMLGEAFTQAILDAPLDGNDIPNILKIVGRTEQ